MDRCWIRHFITATDHFISNITIVKIHKLPRNIYWNTVCLVSTVCIFSMTWITYTYLSNMTCPNRVISWAYTVCVHWSGHDVLVSALINDVTTPPIVTSWIDIISLTFLCNHDHVISILNFPVNDLCHDSIGNKLFGFVFSRSDEPILIAVCGMRLADQDHRIGSEPTACGSFLESGPDNYSKSIIIYLLLIFQQWSNPFKLVAFHCDSWSMLFVRAKRTNHSWWMENH